MKTNLERFIIAQNGISSNGETLYNRALKEIQEGKLTFECWIRYVYPQLKRSGTSKLTEFYGLNGREEAIEYINNPILRKRLIEAAKVILNNNKEVYEIFSNLGVLKIRTCMKLFSSVSNIPEFKQVINKYNWK